MERRSKELEWETLNMTKDEDSDSYFTRCLTSRKDMVNIGLPCSEHDLRIAFILGLPAHFNPIQEKLVDLPKDWRDPDIHCLPDTTTKFYNNKMSVRKLHRDVKDINKESNKQTNKNDNKMKLRPPQDNSNT